MSSRREFVRDALGAAAASAVLPRFALGDRAVLGDRSQWLEEIAGRLREQFGVPAIWLAADVDGRLDAAVVGVRKAGDPTVAALDDRLTVASVSKPMAGLWIATLVESGKIAYDSRVLDVLPELEKDCLHEHREVTLSQLLTHTAGVIRDVGNIPNDLRLDQYSTERMRQAREVVSAPAPPGSKGVEVYSNNGVTLAVTMAERVAGEPYEAAATRFFRDRLGLSSWGVWPMNLKDDASLPWPHSMKDRKPTPHPPSSVQFQFVRPSGSAHCTITDLARFGRLATNYEAGSRGLLKLSTWKKIMAPIPNTSAVLTSFHAYGDRAAFQHSGSLGTTATNLLVIPEWNVSLAIHTNATGDDVQDRGTQDIQDVVRRQRALRNPPPACRITLTGVAIVDSTWRNAIVPKVTDEKIRIRVNFHIETADRTGDLQTLVKLGGVERRDNRLRGLVAGDHFLVFEFDRQDSRRIAASVTVDSLRTAGNQTPERAHSEFTVVFE